MQNGRAKWTCMMNEPHGQAAATCSMNTQHGHKARDIQYGHASWTSSMDMQRGDTGMLFGQAALASNIKTSCLYLSTVRVDL
jgi:hypothetical protein